MRRAQEGTAEEEAAAAGENGGVLMDDDEKLKVAQRSLARRTARALVVFVARCSRCMLCAV